MDQPACLCLGERVADLAEQVHRPLRRHRTESPDERIRIEAVEQLHDVVEGPVVRDPEVEELHGVRRAEAGNGLGFLLEPALHVTRHARG